jgi:type II secretory pathway pseudopilin PulG
MKKLLHKIMAFRQRKGLLRSPKSRYRQGSTSGFTLIELLVAALIASLMVVIMLGFLVGVLETDRKETVKTNAQEELQAAISYIADDLQEAIYIYGAEGLAGINTQLPHTQSGAGNECNPTGTNTCTPILVFWKRFTFNPDSTGTYSSTTANPATEIIGCMPYGDATQLAACRANSNAGNRAYGRDSYTYSLVAYYLKNDDPTITGNSTTGWSQTARILRWEIKDGYVGYCAISGGTIGTTVGCPTATQVTTRLPSNTSALIVTPIPLVDPNKYFIEPSKGFNRPDFTTVGGLAAWKKFANFDFAANPFVTLVDFMDDTAYDSANQGGNAVATGTGTTATATSAFKIPIGKNDVSTPKRNLDCDDPSVGVGTTDSVNNYTQRVPADFTNADGSNPAGLTSFYACVSPETVTVRLFLRGNAIARLTTPAADRTRRVPQAGSITFFPTADVRSFGRSQIGLGK